MVVLFSDLNKIKIIVKCNVSIRDNNVNRWNHHDNNWNG